MILQQLMSNPSIEVFFCDNTGTPLTGKTYTDFPTVYYHLAGANAKVSITLASLATETTAWASGGVIELGGGWYRLDLPTAVVANAMRWVSVWGYDATGAGKNVIAPPLEVMPFVSQNLSVNAVGVGTGAINVTSFAQTTREAIFPEAIVVSGTTSPAFNGVYTDAGVVNNKRSYGASGGNTIWYDNATNNAWVLTTSSGVLGTNYWKSTGDQYGPWINGGGSTTGSAVTTPVKLQPSNLLAILGTSLTETVRGYLAAGFKKLYDVAVPVFTLTSVNQSADNDTKLSTLAADYTTSRAAKLDNLDATISSRTAGGTYAAAPTAAAIRTEMDANSTKLANLDATISSRSTYAGGDTAGTTTLLSRLGTPTGSTIAADLATNLAAIMNVQNGTWVSTAIPGMIERPDSGSKTIPIVITFSDETGAAKNLDSGNPTIVLTNDSGTSLAGRLGSWTNPATGKYVTSLTVSASDTLETLVWEITGVVNTKLRRTPWITEIVDTTAVDFTTSDRTLINAIKAKTDNLPSTPANESTSTAIKAKTDNLPSTPANESTSTAIKAKTDLIATNAADSSRVQSLATAANVTSAKDEIITAIDGIDVSGNVTVDGFTTAGRTALRTALAGRTIAVVSPLFVTSDGTPQFTLCAGDDYFANDSRELRFPPFTGIETDWTGATAEIKVNSDTTYPAAIDVRTGDSREIYVELDSDDSTDLSALTDESSGYGILFDLVVTLQSGRQTTLVKDGVLVVKPALI